MSTSKKWDVIVVGAGPAGSTTAAFLARAGHRVLILEKEEFPRFHIGESLLPLSLPVLEELGIAPPPTVVESGPFRFKRGAQFIAEHTNQKFAVSFGEALDGPPRYAWQVVRSEFDMMIRDRAVADGAIARHGVKVTEVAMGAEEVVVRCGEEELRARYLVDATGQDRLLARKHHSADPYRSFGKSAVFTHFDHLTDAALEEIGRDGDIRVMILPKGWGWMIPLPKRRLSIGLVSQDKLDVPRLDEYLRTSPLAVSLSAGATRLASQIIGNFSFNNRAPSGQRYTCVGDAACFLDPVFSSGVSLALVMAHRTSAVIARALADGTEADPQLIEPVHAQMARGYATFAAIIGRFYGTGLVENLFFGAPEEGEIRNQIVSVLAGDVWREDNPFQSSLLRSRRHAGNGKG